MINAKQLHEYVVLPALEGIGHWSPEAANLVMGTALQESNLVYLHQLGSGPAHGLWQMEPATHEDIWENYLQYRAPLAAAIFKTCGINRAAEILDLEEALIYNLRYGAAMCRVHYLRCPGAIPADLDGQAAYWKAHYNTPLGAGTEEEFIRNYRSARW